MKKFLVIGNPINHSLSPKLHNYWLKDNNIDANYDKRKIDEHELKIIIKEIKEKKINGINVTVPFKKKIIPYLDELSSEAQETQSVNTIYLDKDKLIGHNTDIDGFKRSIIESNFNVSGKKIFILGAGGVVSSIIYTLNKLGASEIFLSNRTKEKAENLKTVFKNLKIKIWGEIPDFDIIINATSVGLKKEDRLNLDFSNVGNNKFFYDVIYNPKETNFLKTGKNLGNKTENGKMMFIYQAMFAFKIWNKIEPKVNEKVIKLLEE